MMHKLSTLHCSTDYTVNAVCVGARVHARARVRPRACPLVSNFESKYINLVTAINVTFSSSFSNYI